MTGLPTHSVSVAGVAVNDRGQVLVIRRRDNGRWEAPGGVLEPGEDLASGVRREILEETGVPVSVDRLTGVYKNMTRAVVAVVFRCTPYGAASTDNEEASAIRWIEPTEVPLLMSPAFAIRITDALQGGPAQARAHDGTNLIDT